VCCSLVCDGWLLACWWSAVVGCLGWLAGWLICSFSCFWLQWQWLMVGWLGSIALVGCVVGWFGRCVAGVFLSLEVNSLTL